MITFLDGFDLHTYTGSSGAGGMQDYGKYWFTSAINGVLGYAEGRQGGQALRLAWNLTGLQVFGNYSSANTVPADTTNFVIGLQAQWNLDNQNPAAGFNKFIGVNWGGVEYQLQLNGQGWMRLAVEGVVLTEVLSPGMQTSWNWFEIEIKEDGEFILRHNGLNVRSVSAAESTPPVIGARPGVTFSLPGTGVLTSKPFINVDHIYMGDQTLAGASGIQAVTVAASMDRWQTAFGGLRGNIIVGGESYQTLGDSVPSSSTATFGNPRNSNVLYMTYPVNPATNQPWQSLTEIDAWGVCTVNLNGGGHIRLSTLALQYLTMTGDGPIINTVQPTNAVLLSGPWQKTNEFLTYPGHINELPRPNVDWNDRDYLFINDLGCGLYRTSTIEPPIQTIGITFAEEYRQDHRDWVTVNGEGEPYESYFIGGFGVFGEGNKKTQGNYITVNYETAPGGQAYLQAIWDYALDPDTGRWSQKQYVYRPLATSAYKHGTSKLKLRGHGKTLQIKVSNYHDSPFVLNGYSMLVTSATTV